jgi:hypothetical protein
MKWVLIIIGALAVLAGAVWILQGTHVLTQGFMAGDMRWTRNGAIVAAVGTVLVVIGATLRRRVKSA